MCLTIASKQKKTELWANNVTHLVTELAGCVCIFEKKNKKTIIQSIKVEQIFIFSNFMFIVVFDKSEEKNKSYQQL